MSADIPTLLRRLDDAMVASKVTPAGETEATTERLSRIATILWNLEERGRYVLERLKSPELECGTPSTACLLREAATFAVWKSFGPKP